MQVELVESGLFPHSQLNGLHVIHFKFKEDSEKYNTDQEAEQAAEKLLNDIKEQLDKSEDLKDDWIDFLLAKEYGVFSGDCLMAPDNRKVTNFIMTIIAHMSHESQKDEPVEFRKRPPMMAYYGRPKYFTGPEQMYENFNLILIDVDPNKGPEDIFAFNEMCQHTFHNVESIVSTIDEVISYSEKVANNPEYALDTNRKACIIRYSKSADKIIEASHIRDIRPFIDISSIAPDSCIHL